MAHDNRKVNNVEVWNLFPLMHYNGTLKTWNLVQVFYLTP